MGTQNGHVMPFLEFASLREKKKKVMKKIKQFIKYLKRVKKKRINKNKVPSGP